METDFDREVVLIVNYANDGIRSMDHFASALSEGLAARGIEVSIVRPKEVLGALSRSAFGLGKWLGYIDKWLLFPLSIPTVIRQKKGAVFHIVDHSCAPYLKYFNKTAVMITCNDMLAIRSALGEIPENPTRWSGRQLQAMIMRGLRRAKFVACISHKTEDDFKRLFPGVKAHTQVIPMGQNFPFAKLPAAVVGQRLQALEGADLQAGKYFLHIGAGAWYKNRKRVLEAYVALRRQQPTEDAKLVFVGPELDNDMLAMLDASGLGQDVLQVSGLGGDTVEALYNGAIALVFPSLAEGFGWPLVEAQACGTLVITSNEEPMRWVSGDAAWHVDARDANAICQAMLEAKNISADERSQRSQISEAHLGQFAPEKMIDAYVALYKKVAEE